MAKGRQKDTIPKLFLAIRNEKQLFNDYHKSVESNIGVRGKSRAPLLMRLLFGFPDDKQFKGACPKSRRDDRTQTGVLTPGSSATTKEAPTGRQSS